MTNVLQRSLALFELLSQHPEGLPFKEIASRLGIPPSATHRLLQELCQYGYAQQQADTGTYGLTIKLAMLGLCYLGRSGVADIAQPILDDLAELSRELIRLSIVDNGMLVWVARAQGARSGLKYDPDMDQGIEAHLSSSASGLAWLMTMSNEEALMCVARQSFQSTEHPPGPNAPRNEAELFERLAEARKRGFTMVIDSFSTGLSAMAAPVFDPRTGTTIAVISVGGPSVRLTREKMLSLGDALLKATATLGQASESSILFKRTAAHENAGENAG